MKFLILLLFISLAFHFSSSKVLNVTTDAFDDILNNNKDVVVDFYAPWCGHCHVLEPEYQKLAEKLEGKIPVARVDGTVETKLADRFNIEAYPTVFLFHGGIPIEYNGEWKEDLLHEWVQKQIKDETTPLKSSDDFSKFTRNNKLAVVGFFASSNSQEYVEFVKTSKKNQEVAFAEVFDSDIAQQNGVTVPGVQFFRHFDQKPLTTSSFSDLDHWVKENIFPLVSPVELNSWERVSKKRNLIATAFLPSTSTDSVNNREVWTQVAEKHREQVGFFTHPDVNPVIFEALEVNEEPVIVGKSGPYVTVYNITAGRFYLFDQAFDFEKLDQFLADLQSHKLTYYLRSQALPKQDIEGGVTVVVGQNFDNVVIKSDKDVLLLVYTPWDPHSQALLPRYESFASENADITTLIFAKVDGTANSLPFLHRPLMGFYLFPANNKEAENPLYFNGEISKPELAKFIAANAGHRINKVFNYPEPKVQEEIIEDDSEEPDGFEEHEYDSFEAEDGHFYFKGKGSDAQIAKEIQRIRDGLIQEGFDLGEQKEAEEQEEAEEDAEEQSEEEEDDASEEEEEQGEEDSSQEAPEEENEEQQHLKSEL